MFYSVMKTAYTAMLCAASGILSAAGSVNARTTTATSVRTRVCDFQSAGDDPSASGSDSFSIWF